MQKGQKNSRDNGASAIHHGPEQTPAKGDTPKKEGVRRRANLLRQG